MKPSERIKEILTELEKKFPEYTDNPLKAVVDYLDEIWQEEQTALRELKDKLASQATCPLDCDCRFEKKYA